MQSQDKGLIFKICGYILIEIVFICSLLIIFTAVSFNNTSKETKNILYNTTLDSYKSEIKSEVQNAISIIDMYYEQYKSGAMTEDNAKSIALMVLRNIRYGDDNAGYFWVDDTNYNLVMHPILPEQEGTNRKDLTDQNGVKIIQSILGVAKEGGYNEFYFTKSDGKTVAPKIAYSKEFEEWNWVVTTGVYADDIHNIVDNSDGIMRLNSLNSKALVFLIVSSVVIALIALVVVYLCLGKLIRIIDVVKDQLLDLADGDLKSELTGKIIERNDEFGAIARSTNHSIKSFRDSISAVKDAVTSVSRGSSSIKDMTTGVVDATSQVSDAIESVAQEATKQAGVVDIVSQNVISLTNVSNDVSNAVTSSIDLMNKLQSNAIEMRKKVESMSDESISMETNVKEIASQILETSEDVEKMKGILESIKKIASETNLLALNASIEAARAGEAGRGFAVVANSIKSLSENTSKELDNIKEIISALTEGFAECERCIGLVVDSNNNSSVSTKAVIDQFSQIDTGVVEVGHQLNIVEQSQKLMQNDIESLKKQVDIISNGAENNAAVTQEVNANVEELASLLLSINTNCEDMMVMVEKLDESTSKFKV